MSGSKYALIKCDCEAFAHSRGHTSGLSVQSELLCSTSEMLLPQMNVSQA